MRARCPHGVFHKHYFFGASAGAGAGAGASAGFGASAGAGAGAGFGSSAFLQPTAKVNATRSIRASIKANTFFIILSPPSKVVLKIGGNFTNSIINIYALSCQEKFAPATLLRVISMFLTSPSTRNIIDSASKNLSEVESKIIFTFDSNSSSFGQ